MTRTPLFRISAPRLKVGTVMALVPFGLVGCYRATGISKPVLVATEIPAQGGDRVAGFKSTGGPGDFFVGNDFVSIAVDGAIWNNRKGQFGAPSGGAILDVGAVRLDQSFQRVPMPSDLVDRLFPVVNQESRLPLVFDSMVPVTESEVSRLEMAGGILDDHGLLGIPTDGSGRVVGVDVHHTLSLAQRGRYFDLVTRITNRTATAIPIYSIGDFLEQRGGGGYRFVIPAQQTSGMTQAGGAAPVSLVHDWGVEVPGSDFTKPLETSIRSNGVGLAGVESAGEFVDSHMSMSLFPMDSGDSQLLVAADPQQVLSETRPTFSRRLVAGKLPTFDGSGVPKMLEPGADLVYKRRLYLTAGPAHNINRSSQITESYNQYYTDRANLFGVQQGPIRYTTFGTATRSGSTQTEIRFERYLAPATFDPQRDLNDSSRWITERVDYLERGETFEDSVLQLYPNTTLLSALPETSPDPTRAGHNQIYRMIVRNRLEGGATPFLLFTNGDSSSATPLKDFLEPRDGKLFRVKESLAPERNNFPYAVDEVGNFVNFRQTTRFFSSRDLTGTASVLQPMRIIVAGLDGSGALDAARDPDLMRVRHWSSIFVPQVPHRGAGDFWPGSVSFRAGNEAFGTGFPGSNGNQSVAAPFELPFGQEFRAFAARGPQSRLQVEDFNTTAGQDVSYSSFALEARKSLGSWISFDLPGPSLASTGGMHPMEIMTSALAEDVQVVGRTEMDRNVSSYVMYNGYRAEFTAYGLASTVYAPIGIDPLVVGSRSAGLPDGPVTALFVPDNRTTMQAAARPSAGWTLADFLNQADGKFTVVHRPLGPGGLFQVHPVNLSDKLGEGANAWWLDSSSLSGGKRMGQFDALELIRGESLASQTPLQWHQEYRDLRTVWFKILSEQSPSAFTKGLGLSSAKYSRDTPVGLARTYLKATATPTESNVEEVVLAALRQGAAVASTGPLLEADVNGTTGSGQLLDGSNATVTLNIALTAPDWVPVEQVRIYVNGLLVQTLNPSTFTVDASDARRRTISLPGLALAKDSWIVVEAGVPDAGPSLASAPWNALYPVWFKLQRNIYPLAITNPIFVNRDGGGYQPPAL